MRTEDGVGTRPESPQSSVLSPQHWSAVMPDNLPYLFAAFVVIWLLIFGYVAFIGGRVQGLRQEVEALRAELDARATAAPAPTAPGTGDAPERVAEAQPERAPRRAP